MSAVRSTRKIIDTMMEEASAALSDMRFFHAERMAKRALERAHMTGDYERMARICLPLQEARRLKRQEALDANSCITLNELPPVHSVPAPGCYLLSPPLIAMDTKELRAICDRAAAPAIILCREPKTSAGKWPIAAVGVADTRPITLRIQLDPPEQLTPSWFSATLDTIGNKALERLDPKWPADHRVLDLLEFLDAVPHHERVIQALAAACREAAVSPLSTSPRRRGILDNPWGF
ncbi:MAG: hypothetical protein IPM33_03410 [Phycisphaerales bacterium]|nr:hypothetical protein [Phycisphaerales bacterium]